MRQSRGPHIFFRALFWYSLATSSWPTPCSVYCGSWTWEDYLTHIRSRQASSPYPVQAYRHNPEETRIIDKFIWESRTWPVCARLNSYPTTDRNKPTPPPWRIQAPIVRILILCTLLNVCVHIKGGYLHGSAYTLLDVVQQFPWRQSLVAHFVPSCSLPAAGHQPVLLNRSARYSKLHWSDEDRGTAIISIECLPPSTVQYDL